MKSDLFKILTAGLIPLLISACGGGITGDEKNNILVEDQILVDLNKVKISEASLEDPAWIVIYESSPGPQQIQSDKIIGHQLLDSGDYQNLLLLLDRDIVNNEKLFAELRKDGGEIGKFEPSGADLVVSRAGINSTPFQVFVSEEPYLRIGDGVLHYQTLIIDKVVATRSAWLVVYKLADAENDSGALLNMQKLTAGHHSNVEIPMPDFNESVGLKNGDKIAVGLYENVSDLGEGDAFDSDIDILLESQGNPVRHIQEISINAQ